MTRSDWAKPLTAADDDASRGARANVHFDAMSISRLGFVIAVFPTLNRIVAVIYDLGESPR
jgi:hypothetical protein